MHGAGGGGQAGSTGVLERLPWAEQRLLAHHAQTLTFRCGPLASLTFQVRAITVRQLTGVGDGDGVGKHVQILVRVGLLGQVLWCDFDRHVVQSHGRDPS